MTSLAGLRIKGAFPARTGHPSSAGMTGGTVVVDHGANGVAAAAVVEAVGSRGVAAAVAARAANARWVSHNAATTIAFVTAKQCAWDCEKKQ